MLKGIYQYEYIYYWKKFNEASLSEKEDFYNHLNMDDITDADYAHIHTHTHTHTHTLEKEACKDFEKKNLGKYHDFNVQCDTLLIADVVKFMNLILPALFFCTRIIMTTSLKKQNKIRPIN